MSESVSMEVLVASSSADAGIGCWDLHTGAEQLRYKSCVSPSHGLVCVGQRFLASSQLRDSSSSSSTGSILYWSWSKPQVEVKSFPTEPIMPVAATKEGTYIVGGGLSGDIFLWEVGEKYRNTLGVKFLKFAFTRTEVLSGRLLKKWHAHYRAVTCLVFSDDDSLLVSGSEDGCIRVWSLLMLFDDERLEGGNHLYEHSFFEHNLRITDIVIGYGGSNAIVVSASEDRTCKVWSLSMGRLLRSIQYPSVIDAVALDPGEHVFYAGGRDGKIYISALNAKSDTNSNHGLHIISSLSSHSKAVNCLAYSISKNWLISGSDDGVIRIWDAQTHSIVRVLKQAKGPVSNLFIVRRKTGVNPHLNLKFQAPSTRRRSSLPPPLAKFENSKNEDTEATSVINFEGSHKRSLATMYLSSHVIDDQIKELQGSASVNEMDVVRLNENCKRSMQMIQHWKKMYENLHQFCVNELLAGEETALANVNATSAARQEVHRPMSAQNGKK